MLMITLDAINGNCTVGQYKKLVYMKGGHMRILWTVPWDCRMGHQDLGVECGKLNNPQDSPVHPMGL